MLEPALDCGSGLLCDLVVDLWQWADFWLLDFPVKLPVDALSAVYVVRLPLS